MLPFPNPSNKIRKLVLSHTPKLFAYKRPASSEKAGRKVKRKFVISFSFLFIDIAPFAFTITHDATKGYKLLSLTFTS